MDKLTEFEQRFKEKRGAWTKSRWRLVAYELAGVEPRRGRPRKTDEDKYQDEQRFRVVEFWRDQEREQRTTADKNGLGIVEPGRRSLTAFEATRSIVVQTGKRLASTGIVYPKNPHKRSSKKVLDETTEALVRAIQVAKKKR